MKKILFTILSICGLQAVAQMSVMPDSIVEQLVQTLTGTGVTVSNATLHCNSQAVGTFSYTGNNLGLSAGVILTTGKAVDIANPQSYFCNTDWGTTFSDQNLIQISSAGINDVCFLAFDFVPGYDCISISYVFGSEEYPDYVSSTYNDVFGIFLTGANPDSGIYQTRNIGALPNGIPVSINNVNAGFNSLYFLPNYDSSYNYNDIAYGGITTLITSIADVYHDSTYHMEIAIADASDHAYDSGVLISAYGINSQSSSACLQMIQGTTGITHSATSKELNIYPNPANSILQITSTNQINAVSVIDVLGNEVLKNQNLNWSNNTTQIDISSLQNGIYFIKAGNALQKFIKQ